MGDVQSYQELSSTIKAPALKMLSKELAPEREQIEKAFITDQNGWWVPYHFYWGMSVRNTLRTKGFDEEYFKIDNLDDFYVPLVEEALGLKHT